MLIFRTFCGFALQILPYAFFCLYPFGDCFKIARQRAFCLFGLLFAALAAAFTWIGTRPDSLLPGEYRSFFMNLFFYITLLVLLGLYLFCIRAHAFQKLFVFFIVMNYGFLITTAVNLMLDIFPYTPDGHMYPIIALLYHLGLNAVLFFPMLRLSRHVRLALGSPVSKGTWLLLALVPGIFILLISVFGYLPTMTGFSPEYIHWIFMQIMLLFMLFIYGWIFRMMDQAREKALQQSRLEAMVANYRKTAEDAAVIRQMRHEMKHHIGALSLYMKSGNYAGAQSYLDKVADIAARMPDAQYTPHPLLNSILTEYRERALRADISVTYHITVAETISMEDTDLCCLLTNLLDNALDGCLRVKDTQRYIRLRIRQDKSFLFFSCENSCDTSLLRYTNGRLVTAKTEDAGSHGLGIFVMKNISAKYNGAFRTEVSSGSFTALVNLCTL